MLWAKETGIRYSTNKRANSRPTASPMPKGGSIKARVAGSSGWPGERNGRYFLATLHLCPRAETKTWVETPLAAYGAFAGKTRAAPARALALDLFGAGSRLPLTPSPESWNHTRLVSVHGSNFSTATSTCSITVSGM